MVDISNPVTPVRGSSFTPPGVGLPWPLVEPLVLTAPPLPLAVRPTEPRGPPLRSAALPSPSLRAPPPAWRSAWFSRPAPSGCLYAPFPGLAAQASSWRPAG